MEYKFVQSMEKMFYNCESLKELPDISKWNTENVINISSAFKYCSSLTSLPDISKWNLKNIIYLKFYLKVVLHC